MCGDHTVEEYSLWRDEHESLMLWTWWAGKFDFSDEAIVEFVMLSVVFSVELCKV